jgi:hypothetical protein
VPDLNLHSAQSSAVAEGPLPEEFRARLSVVGVSSLWEIFAPLPHSQRISPRRHAGAPERAMDTEAMRAYVGGDRRLRHFVLTAHEPAEKGDRGSAATRSPQAFASSVGSLAGSILGLRIRVAFSCFLPGRVVGGLVGGKVRRGGSSAALSCEFVCDVPGSPEVE